MEDLFDTVIISAEIGVKKPDPRIFDPALAETRVGASEVVYVGDTEEDITVARLAKMQSILIQREGKRTDKALLDFSIMHKAPDWENDPGACSISSLSELIALINKD